MVEIKAKMLYFTGTAGRFKSDVNHPWQDLLFTTQVFNCPLMTQTQRMMVKMVLFHEKVGILTRKQKDES